MQIKVKLFGGLRHYLPAGSSFNQCMISLDSSASLTDLIARLPIPEGKPYLVMINDERVTPEQYDGITLSSEDDVMLLPPIKGG